MTDDSLNRRHSVNSTSEVIPFFGGVNASTVGMNMNMIFPRNLSNSPSPSPGYFQAANSSTSLVLDSNSIPGLKHDTGLAVVWSVEEQFKLEQGLLNYTDEPNIIKYIKIAAMLHEKTVRDVAMRCRWMTRKRRKAEEHNLGKKVNNRKDKLVEFNSKTDISAVMLQNNAAYPITMHRMDQNAPISFDVLGISGTIRHLLEQNALAFSQITANLSTFKLQDNIELFCRTRNNIAAILNDMRHTPGIMSHMPPLHESINEDLANSILPHTTQSIMHSLPVGIQLKQEPRC